MSDGPDLTRDRGNWAARGREIQEHVAAISAAILDSVRAGDDLGDVLSAALGSAADELGSVEALVAGRPGSWEAEHVRALAMQYADTPDSGW